MIRFFVTREMAVAGLCFTGCKAILIENLSVLHRGAVCITESCIQEKERSIIFFKFPIHNFKDQKTVNGNSFEQRRFFVVPAFHVCRSE